MNLQTLADPNHESAIYTRLAAFTANARRNWGRMSPGGAVCHLALSFEVALGEASCQERSGLMQRTAIKHLALKTSIPWAHGFRTLPELVEGAPGVQPGVFAQDHDRLLAAFRRFVKADAFASLHPIFGPMSQWEWMRWGYLHSDHHLRQFSL